MTRSIKALVWKDIATKTTRINKNGFLFLVSEYATNPKPIANICLIPENIITNVDIMQNNAIVNDESKQSLL